MRRTRSSASLYDNISNHKCLTIWLEIVWSEEFFTSRFCGIPRTIPTLSPLFKSRGPPHPLNVRDFLMSLLRSGGWSLGLGGGDAELLPDNGLGRWLVLPDLWRINCTSFEYSPHLVNTYKRRVLVHSMIILLFHISKTWLTRRTPMESLKIWLCQTAGQIYFEGVLGSSFIN